MAKTAIVTDSNSGITQAEGKEAGIFVLPMPFLIDGNPYLEDIDLTQSEFYKHLEKKDKPNVANVTQRIRSMIRSPSTVCSPIYGYNLALRVLL